MNDDQAILGAAQAIRPFLKELVPDRASVLDQQLAEHLANAAQGIPSADRIMQQLAQSEATRKWLDTYLKTGAPPGVRSVVGTPPGDQVVIGAPQWVCPYGDSRWFQRTAGTTPPPCPTHHVALVRAA